MLGFRLPIPGGNGFGRARPLTGTAQASALSGLGILIFWVADRGAGYSAAMGDNELSDKSHLSFLAMGREAQAKALERSTFPVGMWKQ